MDVKERLADVFTHLDEHISYNEEYGILFDTPFVKAVEDVLQMLNGVTVQEWISVKDRLPDHDDWVLVCKKTIKTGYTAIAVDKLVLTVGGDKMWLSEYATYKQVVTHWAHLPQPPKGE